GDYRNAEKEPHQICFRPPAEGFSAQESIARRNGLSLRLWLCAIYDCRGWGSDRRIGIDGRARISRLPSAMPSDRNHRGGPRNEKSAQTQRPSRCCGGRESQLCPRKARERFREKVCPGT